ncbi:DUF721 domain-containing protein [Neolewinella lacunae]|uniref:DUF721 domain-containing protein n=1 Tax=Neolewinella lacunae TaxID=1517758 RepID=A0A923TBI9_9BACT|nr:DUF721 domain-containing protein [Neolewinella lacunae]MBC6992652.1 DUF721 domain-containing protein [Neolewinella lacunae]MDN3633532.1 DUF721 domain-containing protein [Neolewinella lacunae]
MKKAPDNTTALKDAFMRLLRTNKNEAGYFKARTRLVWEKFFGKHVADNTRDLMVRNRKLYVYVSNAPLRNQLLMVREGIRTRLNEEFGEEYLEEVVIK